MIERRDARLKKYLYKLRYFVLTAPDKKWGFQRTKMSAFSFTNGLIKMALCVGNLCNVYDFRLHSSVESNLFSKTEIIYSKLGTYAFQLVVSTTYRAHFFHIIPLKVDF